ncbi:MAG: hypothetical protein ACRDD7_08795 [Peptostreptococcaceae bacterium]
MSRVNTIEYATILQRGLDKKAIHSLLTGWMDANAGQIQYTGGNEVKIPQMSTDGLGDYARNGGAGSFANGVVNLAYKTYTMTQDRGRKFTFDENDVDESNFVVTATNVMNVFQEESVVGEIDAYRLSKLATTAISIAGDKNVEYGYTPSATNILAKIKAGIKKIRETGFQGQLVIHANYDVVNELELAMAGKIASVTFSQGGINTQCPSVDNCPIIATPQNRLYSAITLNDGKTVGQEAGGYAKASSAKDVNFIIVPTTVPIAVTKLDKMRIFTPEQYQESRSWALDYRRYHELWVLDNKKELVFANIKDTKAGA